MKVIKRDGKAVDYNREKIEIAIEKANKEVKENKRASKEQIKSIIKYIEDLDKKRILVEDIQDIIEQQLMDMKKFDLAKKYMIYRYTRALVRKQNTTDESILGLIKNKNKDILDENYSKNPFLVSAQRDYIAGEVSKDLSKRILLPEKITKAHEEGAIYFHNMEYFLQPVFNSSLVNIEDMLDNGTVINDKLIEQPKSFEVACIVLTQIISAISTNQSGTQTIDISYLGKYIKKSYEKIKKEIEDEVGKELSIQKVEKLINARLEKEISSGIQTIIYQINTSITAQGRIPKISLFLNLKKDDVYIKENAKIIEEILKQMIKGIKNKKGEYVIPEFPKLIYVLDEGNCLKDGKYDYLTKSAIKCSIQGLDISYISAKKMRNNYNGNIFAPIEDENFLTPWKDENGNYKFKGRFNQGIVSINLPQIGIISDGVEEKFWQILDEKLELCKEALLCRHYALLGTLSSSSPIHWQYGAISRNEDEEKIDKLLKDGYSTISLGYVGLYELTKLITGMSYTETQGRDFSIKVLKHLKETTNKWKKETGLGFSLCGTPDESLCYRFAKIDKEEYGIIKDVTDKECYTKSYHIDKKDVTDEFNKITLESEFQKICPEGGTSYIEIKNVKDNIEDIIKNIYENIQYAKFI